MLVVAKHLTSEKLREIKKLRSHGYSLPEISRKVEVGQGTVWRHIQGVKILDEYKKIWLEKRKPSVKRRNEALKNANVLARRVIVNLSNKEKLLILASLYWAEGAKVDFNLTNTDQNLIRFFVHGVRDVLGIPEDRLRLNIRVYEDMDRDMCVNFWLGVTGLTLKNLSSVNVLFGKKSGKLKYGMCRIRVTKGGSVLKYLVAVRQRIIKSIKKPL